MLGVGQDEVVVRVQVPGQCGVVGAITAKLLVLVMPRAQLGGDVLATVVVLEEQSAIPA